MPADGIRPGESTNWHELTTAHGNTRIMDDLYGCGLCRIVAPRWL